MFLHRVHGIDEISVDIGVKPAPGVGGRGRKPICKINSKSLPREVCYHTVARLQVQDERSLDEGIHEEQRSGLWPSYWPIVAQPQLPSFIDYLGRSGRWRIFAHGKG